MKGNDSKDNASPSVKRSKGKADQGLRPIVKI